MNLNLGKLPVKHDIRTIKFKSIIDLSKLPIIPRVFDVDSQYTETIDNPMFLNDIYGCCVIASRGHMTLRLEEFEQKLLIKISNDEIKTEYFKETGGPDSGLYMLSSLSEWRRGWIAAGKNYKIYAYSKLDIPDHIDIKACVFLLNGVYLGFNVPQSAMNQFNNGQTWDVVSNDDGIVGGHAIYMKGYNEIGPVVVTWGKKQQMTWAFWDKYVDEAYGVVDDVDDWLVGNSPVDVNALNALLNEIVNITPISGSVTFTGKVDNQASSNEVVTIKLQTPNGPDSIVAYTDSQGNYSTKYTNIYGSYSVQAFIPEDDVYASASSAIASFNISETPILVNL